MAIYAINKETFLARIDSAQSPVFARANMDFAHARLRERRMTEKWRKEKPRETYFDVI